MMNLTFGIMLSFRHNSRNKISCPRESIAYLFMQAFLGKGSSTLHLKGKTNREQSLEANFSETLFTGSPPNVSKTTL